MALEKVPRYSSDMNAADSKGNTLLHYIRRRPTMDMHVVGSFVPELKVDNASSEDTTILDENYTHDILSPEDKTRG